MSSPPHSAAHASILCVDSLSVTLDRRAILREVSFDVARGESLAIVGPNGCGKTVLLKALLGIIPHDGSITWRDGVTTGYVPQNLQADRTLPLNVRNLLHAKSALLGCGHGAIGQAGRRVGLTDEMMTRPIGNLCGGHFQRALVALALLGDPDVVFFDEPTTSIDESGEERIYDLIDRLRRELGLTAIIVSHDPSIVARHATRVLSLTASDHDSPAERAHKHAASA